LGQNIINDILETEVYQNVGLSEGWQYISCLCR